jgi:protein-disulfide isomerase
MKRLAVLTTFALGLSSVAGCQQDNRNIEKKLDDLNAKVDQLASNMKNVGAARPNMPRRPQRPQPDPKKTYAVPVAGDPFEGPADAKITIVKAYDYMCPFCARVRGTMDELRKKYGDDVRVVYKQFVVHPQAQVAHLAACAANKQGKFLKMDELLWDKAFQTRQYDDEHLQALAKEAGLDVSRFSADMKSQDCKAWLQKDQGELNQFGVGATPSFFINGRFLAGAQPLPAFTQIVDEELKKANDRINSGTPRSDYYQTWVLNKGEKKLDAPEAAVVKH